MANAVATQQSVLSKDRIEPGSVNIPIGKFPATASSDASNTAGEIASKLITDLNKALTNKNPQAVSQLFVQHGYWRDHLALSWDYHTLIGREKIANFLTENGIRLAKIEIDTSNAYRSPHFGPIDGGLGEVKGVEFFIKFTSDVGSGEGVARVAEEPEGQWKFFMFSTSLFELTGYDRLINHNRPRGVVHGGNPDRQNWLEKRAAEQNFEDRQPQVVIVGKFANRIGHTDHIDSSCIFSKF